MNTHDVGAAAFKASPPVGYAALHLVGVPLPDLVSIAVLIYTALQIAFLIWKWRRAARTNSGTGD